MISKKRGVIQVLIVVFIILVSSYAWADVAVNEQAYSAIGGRYNNEGASEDDCDNNDVTINRMAVKGTSPGWDGDNWWNICNDYMGCKQPHEEGCWFLLIDVDGGDQNDNAWAVLGPGTYFDGRDYIEPITIDSGYDDDDNDAYDCVLDYQFNSDIGLMCSDDGFWHGCGSTEEVTAEADTSSINTITWADGLAYNCTQNELGIFFWQPIGIDYDHDGYTSIQDCDDNPTDDLANCPIPDETSKIDCKFPENSKCAICINPNHPEVCGDSVDNDCNIDTLDDCNKNREACMQLAVIPENEDTVSAPTPLNALNQPFSWINTEEGGFCCGYNGIDDLGKTVEDKDGSGNYLCIKKDPKLVGVGSSLDEIFNSAELCSGEWCLLSASADQQFNILVLKKPGQPAQDVMSDGWEWRLCATDMAGSLADKELDKVVDEKLANHFYCYQEGNQWSWAECFGSADVAHNKNVKGRWAGDSLFSLYLDEAQLAQSEEEALTTVPEKIIQSEANKVKIFSDDGLYKQFYLTELNDANDGPYFDFSGYDQLEMFVRFVDDTGKSKDLSDLGLPVDLRLTVYGPKIDKQDTILYDQSVLGYNVNNPLLANEGQWVHLKINLPADLTRVSMLELTSLPDTNEIQLKNVYLSKKGEVTFVCSGKDSSSGSSWLESFDDGDKDSDLTGEDMCVAHYGKNAWLGNDDEVSVDSANCCGNDANEYYAEFSKNNYGCWNSNPIASGSTVMNTQFKVEYTTPTQQLAYDTEEVNVKLILDGEGIIDVTGLMPANCSDIDLFEQCKLEVKESLDKAVVKLASVPDMDTLATWNDKNTIYCYNMDSCYLSVGSEKSTDYVLPSINFTHSTSVLPITVSKEDYRAINGEVIGEIKLQQNNAQVQTYLYNPISGETTDKLNIVSLAYPIQTIYLVAELNDNYYVASETISEQKEASLTYSCAAETCIYPLPGEPPYHITNSHPELYELYFIDQKDQETLVAASNQLFNKKGNLKATKVAQQVIYSVNNNATAEDYQETESGFYGCEAASYLSEHLTEETSYCSVKSDLFCSPFAAYKEGKDRYTTINSWSNTPITQVGYQEVAQSGDNVTEMYSATELMLKDMAFPASERTHASLVLPTRNFLSNAEFKTDAVEIPHWEIWAGAKIKAESEKEHVDERNGTNVIVLNAGEILRSERIALGGSFAQEAQFMFTANTSCNYNLKLVDKDGNFTELLSKDLDQGKFKSAGAAYVVVEFEGPCEVSAPFLQLVDKSGPGEYNYNQMYKERAALACCPESYCWNGYACVQDMSNSSALTEFLSGGRTYRCIKGEWKSSPVQWDWNKQRWGYCPTEDQCFVLGSDFGGNAENSAQTFYEGKYPICVNSTQAVFDHYCDAGKWTSRTKYLATKLMEVAESNDYVLYCTNYGQALFEYDNRENYFGGDLIQESTSLGENPLAPQQAKTVANCFAEVMDEEGKRLVPEGQNTCVNNICILRYKEGGTFKTAFATTLNRKIDDPASFLLALNIPQSQLGKVCSGEGEVVECNFAELEGNLWYSPALNAITYGKQGIQLTPSMWDKMQEWFVGIFGADSNINEIDLLTDLWVNGTNGVEITPNGTLINGLPVEAAYTSDSELADDTKFVSVAQDYNNLYLLSIGNHKVRAMKEAYGDKQTLVAEYENFDTPVCEYTANLKVPPEMQSELLEILSDMDQYSCKVDGSKQRVEAVAGLDFLWPQLTGVTRVEGVEW